MTSKTPPPVDVVTLEELMDRGFSPNQIENGFRKIISGLDLDILVATNDIKNKWIIAPDGWYWKRYREKYYFNFEWYELEEIPV